MQRWYGENARKDVVVDPIGAQVAPLNSLVFDGQPTEGLLFVTKLEYAGVLSQ